MRHVLRLHPISCMMSSLFPVWRNITIKTFYVLIVMDECFNYLNSANASHVCILL